MSITVNFKKNICFVHISNNFDGYNLNFYYIHFLGKCNLYFNIFPRQRFLFCFLFVLKSTGEISCQNKRKMNLHHSGSLIICSP